MAGQYNVVQYSDEETMVIMAEQYNVVQYWWRNNGYHDWTILLFSTAMKKQWLSWLNNTKRLNNTKMLSVSTDKGINGYQGWTIQCSTNNVVYLCFKNRPPGHHYPPVSLHAISSNHCIHHPLLRRSINLRTCMTKPRSFCGGEECYGFDRKDKESTWPLLCRNMLLHSSPSSSLKRTKVAWLRYFLFLIVWFLKCFSY